MSNRPDSFGFFWQDLPVKRGELRREMPPIPDTGWQLPTEFPRLENARALAVDVEAKDLELKAHGPGWARGRGHIVGVSVGTDDGYRRYFPMRHEIEPEWNLQPDHVLAWLRHTLSNPRQPKIGAHLTYDVGWLAHEGVPIAGSLYDVQFAEALLNERLSVALDDLGYRYLGMGKVSNTLYRWCSDFYGGNPTEDQRKNIYRTPARLTGPYAEGDVDLPLRIIGLQWPLLIQQGLMNVFELESQLIPMMVAMRFAGVTVDTEQAELVKKQLEKRNTTLMDELREELGFYVEVEASASLARTFDHLHLGYSLTEKGNPSFTASFLEKQEHPVVDKILAIRRNNKLIGTFLNGYIINAHVNGKVYGQFHQLRGEGGGARSGRLSSSDPNLQNIPVRSKLGKKIRHIFIPDPGHTSWLKLDYSQIEYRCLAHFALGPGSDELRYRYNQDPKVDFHDLVMELVASFTGEKMDRGPIKTINFGLLYGMGIFKLTNSLGLSKTKGKELFAAYHAAAPFTKATFDACSAEANRTGMITTVLGRISRFDLWEPAEYQRGRKNTAVTFEEAVLRYAHAKRAYTHKALNRRLQGSAADIMKAAMLKLWYSGVLNVLGVPRLTVHDELDFSIPDHPHAAEAKRAVIEIMENALPLRVPVRVTPSEGPNWGEAV